ncbi:MAG: M20/M25/M40 family metallo-hydrolase [Gemmatimonadales bacterium]
MDPVELTRALVAVESPTGAEGPVVGLLAGVLERAGYRVTRQPVSPGRDNIYAWREPPAVVFSTHLDCVPPYVPLREDAEWVHGRGTCDAKGLAAAMTVAAERLAERGERRVGLLFVVGEENGSDGAHAAAALEPKGRFLVNGEPTENRLCIGQKGSLRCDLEATGRAAHSAYPDEGHSAVEALLDTLERIRQLPFPVDPLLGPSTLNVGTIQGGVAPNVLAPSARAQVLIRTVGPTEALKATLAATAAPGVQLSIGLEIPAYKGTAPAGWETTVVSYASDLPFYGGWGRRFQLGPGTILLAHTEAERIRKSDLHRGVELYVQLATDLLAHEAA